MVTIRAYTTIEQSKKLAEILPLESADMCYLQENGQAKTISPLKLSEILNVSKPQVISCWSLAALLSILPKYEIYNNGETIQLDVNPEALATEGDEVLLDLVVNMIIHLHELNLL